MLTILLKAYLEKDMKQKSQDSQSNMGGTTSMGALSADMGLADKNHSIRSFDIKSNSNNCF